MHPATKTGGGWEVATFGDGTIGRAQFSPDRMRRYCLIRRWQRAISPDVDKVMALTWVMLNPSTAGAAEDDATIRKCVGYAKRWGYGGIRVLNLFDLIETDSEKLKHPAHWPKLTSPENEATWAHWLTPLFGGPEWSTLELKPEVVVAWGDGGRINNRDQWAAAFFVRAGLEPTCLGVTQAGQPLHPGRTSYALERTPWKVL